MTLFTRIIRREIPAEIVYEDDLCLAFRDIHPQAPTHVLLVPKREIPSVDDFVTSDAPLLGHLLVTARSVALQLGLSEGYRLVVNNGSDGGQTVPHLHIHILGGRALAWPPG